MASMQAFKRCVHARSTETTPDPRAAFARQRPHVHAPRSAPLLATANGQLTAVADVSTLKPSSVLRLVEQWPGSGNTNELVQLANDASNRVKEFSPQQLVTLIYFLAGYLHGPGAAMIARQDLEGLEQQLEGGIGGTSVGVPTLLLEEAARRIAGAIQNNRLTAHEIAQAVWSFALAGSYDRTLFDVAARALLDLPKLDDPELTCTGCGEVDQEGNPILDAAGAEEGDDAPCPAEDVRMSDLGHQDLYRLAWAYTAAREKDERHRAVRDVPLMESLAEMLRPRLVDSPTASIVGLLTIFSSIPHYEPRFFEEAAKVLLQRQLGVAGAEAAEAAAAGAGAPRSEEAEDRAAAVAAAGGDAQEVDLLTTRPGGRTGAGGAVVSAAEEDSAGDSNTVAAEVGVQQAAAVSGEVEGEAGAAAAAILVDRPAGGAGRWPQPSGVESVEHNALTLAETLAVIKAYSKVGHRRSRPLMLHLMDWVLTGNFSSGGGGSGGGGGQGAAAGGVAAGSSSEAAALEVFASAGQAGASLLPSLGSTDLLDLALAMSATDCFHTQLMRAIVSRADRTGNLGAYIPPGLGGVESGVGSATGGAPGTVGVWEPQQLLELARVIASAEHTDPEFHQVALPAILRSVHMSHLEEDVAMLTDHCGSTTPDGLKK